MLQIVSIVVLLVGLGLAAAFARPAFNFYQVRRAGSSCVGAAVRKAVTGRRARVQLRGLASARNPVEAPATRIPCLYFRHRIEERVEVEHTVEDGLMFTGESWAEAADVSMHVPFALRDETGSIDVDPERARFVPVKVLDGTEGAPGYRPDEKEEDPALKAVARDVDRGRGRGVYRTFEWIVPLDGEVFVTGTARGSGGGAVVEKGRGPFIVGSEPGGWLVEELGARAAVFALGAGLSAAGATGGILSFFL